MRGFVDEVCVTCQFKNQNNISLSLESFVGICRE